MYLIYKRGRYPYWPARYYLLMYGNDVPIKKATSTSTPLLSTHLVIWSQCTNYLARST